MPKRIPESKRRRIRKFVKDGTSRYAAVRKFGVSYVTVCKIATGIPVKSGYPGIRGGTLKLLQTLVKDGCFIPRDKKHITASSYHTLKKYLPVRRIIISKKSVYFLKGKEGEAFKTFMKEWRNPMPYQKLCSVMKAFGLKLSQKERREIKGECSE